MNNNKIIGDLKIEFKVENFKNSKIIRRKGFKDKNERWWGEYISYYENIKTHLYGFYIDGLAIGMWTYYNEDGSIIWQDFYSFEKPGEPIDENEYKRQLVKIRLGLLKVPALSLKIFDYE